MRMQNIQEQLKSRPFYDVVEGLSHRSGELPEDATFNETVSYHLASRVPRISDEIFAVKTEICVPVGENAAKEIDEWYELVRREDGIPAKKLCKAKVPLFAYAPTLQKEIIYEKIGAVTYANSLSLKLPKDNAHTNLYVILGMYRTDDKGLVWKWESSNHNENLGSTVVNIESMWTAPFNLDVCINVPKPPDSIVELSDETLFNYYDVARGLAEKCHNKRPTLHKPQLGVLWAPDDSAYYCSGDVPVTPKIDPALILDIPDPDKKTSYRHLIASWDTGEEKLLKNWIFARKNLSSEGKPN